MLMVLSHLTWHVKRTRHLENVEGPLIKTSFLTISSKEKDTYGYCLGSMCLTRNIFVTAGSKIRIFSAGHPVRAPGLSPCGVDVFHTLVLNISYSHPLDKTHKVLFHHLSTSNDYTMWNKILNITIN